MVRSVVSMVAGGVLLGAAVLGGVVSGAVGAASAVVPAVLPEGERAAGQWYMSEWFNFDKLAARGATGEGVKIAVIDTALNPDVPELAGANIKVMGSTCIDPGTGEPWEAVNADPAVSAHGTNAVAMLVGNGVAGDGGAGARGVAPQSEIMFYGVGPVEADGADGRMSYWSSCVLTDPSAKTGSEDLLKDSALNGNYGTGPVVDNTDGADRVYAKGVVQQGDSTALAARAAIRDGADVISLSIDSGNSLAWVQVMIEALRAGVPVVVGTDNPTDELFTGGMSKTYQINGVVAVNALEPDGKPLRGGMQYEAAGASNLAFASPGRDLLGVGVAGEWGPELIHGTSYATPLVAGTIALGMQAFPEASAFQVLQAMIRSTGNGELHQPNWSRPAYGYGTVNPVALLDTVPSDFPDENPLYVTSFEDSRCDFPEDSPQRGQSGAMGSDGYWQCYWSFLPTPDSEAEYWAAREGDTPESPGGVAEPSERDDALPVWMFVVGGVGLLVVVAAAVLVPVLVTRSRKRSATQQQLVAQQTIQSHGYQQQAHASYPVHPPQQPSYQPPPGQPGPPTQGGQS